MRAEASLETANIRLGYTRITAGWSGGDDQRVVAERYVDEGETVSANTPLLRIVELDPITGVIFVTERDYARLQPGQEVLLLTTDAYPGEDFQGRIERIAPVFRAGHPPGAGRADHRQSGPAPQTGHVHPRHGGAGPQRTTPPSCRSRP